MLAPTRNPGPRLQYFSRIVLHTIHKIEGYIPPVINQFFYTKVSEALVSSRVSRLLSLGLGCNQLQLR